MKNKILVLIIVNLLLVLKSQFYNCQSVENMSDIILELDESDIRNLNLKLKWKFKPNTNKIPTRFVLLQETKRINLTSFLFDYSSPELIDDEAIVQVSKMKPENFKKRYPLYQISSIDCSLSCINSTRFSSVSSQFDCNIFYYDASTRTCVLYEYDFKNNSKKKRNYFIDDIYDYFTEDCDMDEVLGKLSGYSRLCRRILDYRDTHIVKVNPFIDYRFSISIRDENNNWTPFLRKEYQYTPKITIDVQGDLKLGNNISLVCKTELSPTIVDSIQWKNYNPTFRNTLKISSLNMNHFHQTFYCEIRFNFFRMIQKAYKLNISALIDEKPRFKLNYSADIENLNVNITWNVSLPDKQKFQPEKLILLYSENNQNYKLVTKYLTFQLSNYDQTRFSLNKENLTVSNEEECAMKCLQRHTCEHFTYSRKEPYKNSYNGNCKIAGKTINTLIPCKVDEVCATIAPFESFVKNDLLNIPIFPNANYRFKLQLKDKNFNWTNLEETGPIFLPLKISIYQKGNTTINENNLESKFSLECNTNINRSFHHQIVWLKDDKEISTTQNLYYTQYDSRDKANANSVLEFRFDSNSNNISAYNGVYKCKVQIIIPDLGPQRSYISDPKQLDFDLNLPLKYNVTKSNLTLPTLPGLLLEISCQVYGTPVNSLKWLVDGKDYNDHNTFPDDDDPFIINFDDNNFNVNNILVIKTDFAKKTSKYECILNDDIVIRSHYITIIDERPEVDLKVDTSNLTDLKLTFNLKVRNKMSSSEYKDIDVRPIKFSIFYSENSTYNNAFETIIAPNTISTLDKSKLTSESSRIPIGSLRSTQHGIQSCKIFCFQLPFCKSYEYMDNEDMCNLYSNTKTDDYYKNLIDNLKQKYSESNFNLIHLIRGDLTNSFEEDVYFNNTIIIDKKVYNDCQTKQDQFNSKTVVCVDDLNDFNEKYTMDNLVPFTTYQFKIEIVNAFGKSTPYYTDLIKIPFPLNPIQERSINEKQNYYSLECTTPLKKTKNLNFKWLKNEQLIEKNDVNFQIVNNNLQDDALFKTELILKGDPVKLIGIYTCLLSYIDDTVYVSTNESFIFRPNVEPTYSTKNDLLVRKKIGDMWSESCTAEGWPLPNLQWYFKNSLVANQSDESLSSPYMISHHRNLTTTSYIIAQNISQSSVGVYSCMLNGKILIKNVSLQLENSDDQNQKNKSDSKNDEIRGNVNNSSSNKMIMIPVIAIAFIACFSILSAFIYLKKKQKSDLTTSLSYNRIEEELMTGVDNANLTDDN